MMDQNEEGGEALVRSCERQEARGFPPPASPATTANPAIPNRESSIPLTAIVLAGGLSSRMGQDKALLTIGGVPLLRIVCSVALALCEPVYVVTPWIERYQHLLSPQCQFIREVPLSEGLEEGRGAGSNRSWGENYQLPITNSPLVGFAQGLAWVKTEWVLLLACDLPRLRVEVLRDWATTLDSVDPGAIALLTHHAKGWDPLCGFYRRSCLATLTQYINSGGRSFQHWLAQHWIQVLPEPDAQMLFNCNTPADYEEIRSSSKFS